MSRKSNNIFLDQYLQSSTAERSIQASSVILPIDELLIERRLLKLEEKTQLIAQERAMIAAQSGDDWHDGAFNESDREVHNVDRDTFAFKDRLRDTVVDYPNANEDRITLGSKVTTSDGKKSSTFELVSLASLHEIEDSAIRPLSLEAPITRELIGKRVGEIALLKLPRLREIEIIAIDQSTIRERDERLRNVS